MNLLRKLVSEFHTAFGAPNPKVPTVPPNDRVRLRLQLIREEFFELLDACLDFGTVHIALRFCDSAVKALIEATVRVDMVKAADAFVDLEYVTEGAMLEFGIDSGPLLEEVHRSNMAKKGGATREDGKYLKPEGWTPPDIAGVLARQAEGGPEAITLGCTGWVLIERKVTSGEGYPDKIQVQDARVIGFFLERSSAEIAARAVHTECSAQYDYPIYPCTRITEAILDGTIWWSHHPIENSPR